MPTPRPGRSRWRGLVLAAAVAGLGSFAVAPAAHAATPAPELAAGAASSVAEAKFGTIRMVVGPSYVDTEGNTWTSGSNYDAGTTASFDNAISGTDKDPLYQRERYGIDGYDIAVPDGTYRTTLNLAELWFTAAGQRVFDVRAEGAAKLSGVDIFAKAGGTNRALQLTFDTVVTDGSLSLDFVDRVNQAKVSSIRVERLSTPSEPGYSKVASVHQNTGESWADACIRTMTYGYTGCVRYLNPKIPLAWEPAIKELADKAGNRRVDIQLTAKVYDHDGLEQVLKSVPAAWKSTFKFNFFQEPEDNLLTGAEQAKYRATYTDAAKLTRQYGFQLPWIELQEWGVNPMNNKGWNIGGFIPPAGDYEGVLWSLFEFHERDVLDGQVANIKAGMAKYAPGKPWGLMAAEYAIPIAHVNDASQQAQAKWLTHAFDLTRAEGSVCFAWFNMRYDNGALTEGRVEENKYALAALQATGN